MQHEALTLLLAEREIREQLHTCCRALDRLDLPLLQSVWHADGRMDDGHSGLRGSVARLAGTMIEGLRSAQCHAHHISNIVIDVNGDRAVSESYVAKICRSISLVDSHYHGRCIDNWSKREGRWAIDHRHAVCSFAWDEPGDDCGRGMRPRRDRADPVYQLFTGRRVP